MEQIVIVYGSAADPAATSPGDVDVAYTGPRDSAQRIIADWAAQRGLGGVPVDWHPAQHMDGTVILPAPCGQEGAHKVLAGDVAVKWEGKYGLASYVRAYGQEPGRLAAELRNGKTWWRLTVIPAPGVKPNREREYVEGLTALRSAVAKRPAARKVLAAQWPTLFPRLLEEDPQPSAEDLEAMRTASAWASSGAVIVLLTSDAVRLQYGYDDEDVAAMLYPMVRR